MYFGADFDDMAVKKQRADASSSALFDVPDGDDSSASDTHAPPRLATQSRLELEVTYDIFLASYWPSMINKFNSANNNQSATKLNPSVVWTEIRSHIKGSAQSLASTGKLKRIVLQTASY
jgi:hypothetical protein